MEQNRVRKGVPTAGRFAATEHAEPSVTLTAVDTRPVAGASPVSKRDLLGPGSLADRSPAWSAYAIKKFLGDPDKEIRNPVYRNGPKMRMFLTSRVEEIEASDEWKAWEESNRRRRAAASGRRTAYTPAPPLTGHGRNGSYPVEQRFRAAVEPQD